MDRDQDRYYEEEPQQQGAAAPYQPQEDSDLDVLFNFLEQELERGSSVPLTNKRLIDVEKCLDIVANMREELPIAVQQAERVLAERQKTLSQAERKAADMVDAADARARASMDDADRRAQKTLEEAEDRARKIIEDAEVRARAMIDQSEVKRRAEEEARNLIADARAEANEQRIETANYVDEVLGQAEEDVASTLEAIRKSRKNMSGKR